MHSRQRSSWKPANQNSLRTFSKRRSGLITFWALVTIPVFLFMLCLIFEVGNLWAARIQLKNALEAAALAGADSWGDAGGGDTTAARAVANTYAAANILNGDPVDLSSIDLTLNDTLANTDNDNTACTGVLVFGVVTSSAAAGYVFDASATNGCVSPPDPPNPPPYDLPFAVRAQATYEVPSICDTLFGIPIGPFSVTAKADALYDCASGQPRVYHLDNLRFTCP